MLTPFFTDFLYFYLYFALSVDSLFFFIVLLLGFSNEGLLEVRNIFFFLGTELLLRLLESNSFVLSFANL